MTLADWVALAMLWWKGNGRAAIVRWLVEPRGAGRMRAGPRATLETVTAVIDPSLAVAGRLARARTAAQVALATAHAAGITVVPWSDARYPTALAAIADPPPVLWIRGDLDALRSWGVAIVGSRAGSPYAREVGRELGSGLAQHGVTVVSGLARGVDAAAHLGALAVGGRTVGVLGSGVDIVYPPEHTELAREVIRRGALVSELPPGTTPKPGILPATESSDQRFVAGGGGRGGLRAQRVPDHGASGARTRSRGDGSAGQRAQRPEPRRPRPAQGRCKGCRGCGRYPGRGQARREGGTGHAGRRRGDPGPSAAASVAWRKLRSGRSDCFVWASTDLDCCRVCWSSSSPVGLRGAMVAGLFGTDGSG